MCRPQARAARRSDLPPRIDLDLEAGLPAFRPAKLVPWPRGQEQPPFRCSGSAGAAVPRTPRGRSGLRAGAAKRRQMTAGSASRPGRAAAPPIAANGAEEWTEWTPWTWWTGNPKVGVHDVPDVHFVHPSALPFLHASILPLFHSSTAGRRFFSRLIESFRGLMRLTDWRAGGVRPARTLKVYSVYICVYFPAI